MLKSYFESLGSATGGVKLCGRLVVCVCKVLVTRRLLGILSHGVCAGNPVGRCSNKKTTRNHQTCGGRAFQGIYLEG